MSRIILFILLLIIGSAIAGSCYAGRGACYASCVAQNCATGYCVPAGSPAASQICSCIRCGLGPKF